MNNKITITNQGDDGRIALRKIADRLDGVADPKAVIAAAEIIRSLAEVEL